MNKIKKILIMVVIIFAIVLCALFIIKIKNCKNEIEKEKIYNDYKKKYEEDNFYYENIIEKVLKSKDNWNELPLSDNFKKKYKNTNIIEKDGWSDIWFDDRYYNKEKKIATYYMDYHPRAEEIRIKYSYNNNYELDDIEIMNRKVLIRENGAANTYLDMYESPGGMLYYILNPWAIDNEYTFFDISDNFKNKYPDFQEKTILNEIEYKVTNRIEGDDNNYIYTEQLLDYDKTYYYKVVMKVNEENQLDDIEFTLLREEPPMDKEQLDEILLEVGHPDILNW